MSKESKSLLDRVIELEGRDDKSKVSDPNLTLFSNDEYRYKAYRWYCLKNIVLKVAAIVAGSTALGSGIIEIIRNSMG
jgi:hypothetical protein